MKTLTDATLYIVNGPRGPYYAVHERETGAVLTERTESAAMALANEKDMLIVDRQEISHAGILEVMAQRSQNAETAASGPSVSF
jgi:hypothetical protein